jgi:very-short-patch-repair endonuclease
MRAPTVTFERARSLRRAMTLPEVLLWQDLRGCRCAGLRFRRQHPIGPYILDFYCAEMRLAVEVDGAAHDHEGQARHDARRDAWLAQRDIRVMRLAARDVLDSDGRRAILDVIAAIVATNSAGEWAPAPSTTLRAVPLPRDAGEDGL